MLRDFWDQGNINYIIKWGARLPVAHLHTLMFHLRNLTPSVDLLIYYGVGSAVNLVSLIAPVSSAPVIYKGFLKHQQIKSFFPNTTGKRGLLKHHFPIND